MLTHETENGVLTMTGVEEYVEKGISVMLTHETEFFLQVPSHPEIRDGTEDDN